MHKLIVTAHPSSQGFTHEISKTLELLSVAKGDTVEILNLYTTDLHQDFLKFEDIRTYRDTVKHDKTTQALQARIQEADEIVLVFPTWWGDMPAIMKNWMDSNFMAGFAFEYTPEGKLKKLLTGKTARIITTCGAPSFFYKILLHVQILWNMNRIGYCGIRQKSFTVFGEMDSRKTDRSKYLEKLKTLV